MCQFCPGGLDDPDLALPTDDGATCGTMKAFADMIPADHDMCPTVQAAEAICCPGGSAPADMDSKMAREDARLGEGAFS